MKIDTIHGEKVDTDKLSDIRAEMIELIEKSGIKAFAEKHDGLCYAVIGLPNERSWATMHLNSKEKMDYFIGLVDSLVQHCTDKKFGIAVVPKTNL